MDTNQIDILLVEDNVDEAELTIRALKKNKAAPSLMHMTSGEEALDYIFCQGDFKSRNIQNIPKLILLDLKMPRVDGIEILRRIKWDERTKVIPTVILTSSKEDRDIIKSYQLGANSYFVKPVDFEGFVKAISDLTRYWLELNQPPY
ncbi:response regulator [Pontibacter cellulosilyticus]|uniref:Response regulator n=1 Tax=Pontibacter cellulosilyticus TaxID=1720253 RepID=A0A923N600_9BACT|nr:response regulator [Pontibacter cellulosilyticus]MBC5993540.1 response regulator [Pontibacter cellulosilyticus]